MESPKEVYLDRCYLIFINDLPNVLTKANSLLYADDTIIFKSDKEYKQRILEVQRDLNSIEQWCKTNKLSLDCAKTRVMTFGTQNKI